MLMRVIVLHDAKYEINECKKQMQIDFKQKPSQFCLKSLGTRSSCNQEKKIKKEIYMEIYLLSKNIRKISHGNNINSFHCFREELWVEIYL